MITTNRASGQSHPIRHFFRHYAEMLAAMVLGMVALGMPADHLLHLLGTSASDSHPTTMIISMAVTMTAPMVAWMRYRGHSWRVNAEMTAAMVIPTIAAVCLLQTRTITAIGPLMVIEHAAMLACMLVAMLLRFDEYSAAGHARGRASQAIAA
jgi:flagellar biosynthetic protein FliP